MGISRLTAFCGIYGGQFLTLRIKSALTLSEGERGMRLLREPWPQPTIHCIIDYGMGAIVSARSVLHRCRPQPGSGYSLADHLPVCGPSDGDGGCGENVTVVTIVTVFLIPRLLSF